MHTASLHCLRAPARAPLTLALAAALGMAGQPGLATAATYLVVTSGDAGTGTCAASCTLRDAIAAANSNSGADVITFDSTLSGDTIVLDIAGKGDITITDGLTIQGLGADRLTVSGGDVASTTPGGIFHVTASANIAISDITLAHGNTAHAGGALSINANATLTLSGVTIENNHAQSGGGGLYLGGSSTTITHSTISSNSSYSWGGAFVTNYDPVSLIDSTVYGNSAGTWGGACYGRGSITANNSTISGNSAGANGGGFMLFRTNIVLTNTIVAGNSSPGYAEFAGETQSTIASNLTVNNSLIKGSYHVTGTSSGTNNIIGQDPLLGPLANNSGPTKTLTLLPGSPAIDTGNNATCETTDQRGLTRPYDGDGNGTATCDMGAVESDRIFANGFE